MPGKILIIDNIATNRIVMKVKLAASCYQVAQAATAAEGLAVARDWRPDVILCASQLPDMRVERLLEAIMADPKTARIPVIIQTADPESASRLALLSAGASDLLLKPGDDKLLLARMRSILRLSEMEEELSLREHEHRALGLAEDPEQFTAPGRVAILAADMKTAVRWQSRIAPHTAARIQPSGFRDAIRHAGNTVRPDVLVLMLTSQSREAGLQVLADLRAKTETRDCGIIAVVEGEHAPKIAAEALDIGANDVVAEPAEAAEIALRIARQTMRKRRIKRLREDLRDGLRAAMTDPLTGLYNRRYAIPRLTQIAAEAEKYSRNYAVMIIDIDHFKLINDQFGHSAGDSVLIRVANVLKSALGTQGILARIGGDEFMVTLPNAGSHEAQLMAKRLCRAVRESCRPTAGSNRALQATVSIGVAMASAPAPAAQGELPALWQSPELTLEQADRALYRAKARGRNRVSLGAARSAA